MRFAKLLLHSAGEIVMVVIGTLMVLQINDLRKVRAKELHYSGNIKISVQTTIEERMVAIEGEPAEANRQLNSEMNIHRGTTFWRSVVQGVCGAYICLSINFKPIKFIAL